MRNKKVIALIILTALAAISLIYGITASPRTRTRSPTVIESWTAMTPPGAKSVISTERRARRSKFKTWKRSPFISGQMALSMTELTLNGIIWNKVKPKAMIGDAIVSKGDTIGANRVVDIQPNKVIMNDGTKDFELRIEK